MKVIQIEPLDKRRRKVLLDEGFALVLYGGEIRRYKLEEGAEVAAEVYEEIVGTLLSRRARERMVYLLKASDKTEAELRRKLRDAWYPEPAIEAAIAFGKQHRYIDDAGYAERYIRYQGTRKSKKQLSYELQQKGIDREIIKECMEVIPIDEEHLVRTYLRKKGLSLPLSGEESRKASQSLARKGVSWDVIRRVLRDDTEWES